MNLLDWINQGIDGMTQVAGPGMDSLGFRIFIALLTTMMVWFGVQEALSSSQGGAGFNFAKFVHFVVLASFAYTLIEFYDNTIPGVGYSFRQFITVGSTDVAKIIGADGLNQLNKTVNDMQSNMGANMIKAAMDTYYAIVIVLVQVLLAIYTAAITAIVAYGELAAAVVGLLGPLFIPFLLVEKLSFLFWRFYRLQLLQSGCRRRAQHSGSSLSALLYELDSDRTNHAHHKVTAPDPSGAREYLLAFPDSGDHQFDLFRTHRPRRRTGHSRTRKPNHLDRQETLS